MCLMCGEPGFAHAFQIVARPAHRLTGRFRSVSEEKAAAGALRPLVAEMQALSARTADTWKSPILGLTWRDGTGWRCFAGIETGDEAPGFERLDVPEMYCAGLWHGPRDGAVTDRYAALAADLEAAGVECDRAFCEHREEYPLGFDPDAPALRLLLPVKPDEV